MIAISASRLTSPADIPAGIDAYVPKPFDLNDLIALIKQHIQDPRFVGVERGLLTSVRLWNEIKM